MKTIKVKFCDGFHDEDLVFLPILKKHYQVVLSDQPDYLFYSVFGGEHFNYDCVKIFTTGEAVVPNFNECDYATGFDDIRFGDRYLRLPLCAIMYRNGANVLEFALKRGSNLPEVAEKGFCSFVVSNGNGMPERERMYRLLSQYKKVDSGGRFMNNVGGPLEDKLAFEHAHKFSLCFENERYPGYTTEKLVDAFAAGTIPIYYGDPKVTEYFNEKAFVNVADFDGLEAAAAFVKKLDQEDGLYQSMLSEPVLKKKLPGAEEIEAFLCNIMNQSLADAKRAPRGVWAKKAARMEQPDRGRVYDLCIKPYRMYTRMRRQLKK